MAFVWSHLFSPVVNTMFNGYKITGPHSFKNEQQKLKHACFPFGTLSFYTCTSENIQERKVLLWVMQLAQLTLRNLAPWFTTSGAAPEQRQYWRTSLIQTMDSLLRSGKCLFLEGTHRRWGGTSFHRQFGPLTGTPNTLSWTQPLQTTRHSTSAVFQQGILYTVSAQYCQHFGSTCTLPTVIAVYISWLYSHVFSWNFSLILSYYLKRFYTYCSWALHCFELSCHTFHYMLYYVCTHNWNLNFNLKPFSC